MLARSFILIILSLTALSAQTQTGVKGLIRLPDNEPASFSTVAATNLKSGKLKGTNADSDGRYSLNLEKGEYVITAHLMGYRNLDTTIVVGDEKWQLLNLVLEENPAELGTVQVFADRRGIAREVVSNAIDARKRHMDANGNSFSYESYSSTSVQCLMPDTANVNSDSTEVKIKERERPIIRVQYHLSEMQTRCHIKFPGSYAEEILGVNEFTKDKPSGRGASASVSISYGESDIIPQQWSYDDNYVLKSFQGFHEFDVYNRLLYIPSLTDKKILSPVGEGALLSYAYDLESVEDSSGIKLYRISFKGLFPGEPLLKGSMTIRSSDWAVTAVKYGMPRNAMKFFNDLEVSVGYNLTDSGLAQVKELDILYIIEDGRSRYYGSIKRKSDAWIADSKEFEFSEEIRKYDVSAFDRDSSYWQAKRIKEFDALEISYIKVCDSLQALYASDEYYAEVDSAYNALRWIDFLLYGIGYRNREKDYSFYINPLTMQVNPFGIGGYRHRLGGTFQKDFENAYTMEIEGEADYGFRNSDLRGRGGVGLTYVPLKFVRTFVRFGDYYDMVNNYASLGSIFSRSNYVRTQTWSVAQRMEVLNGLFAELTFEFSDQKPIVNLLSDRWSQQVFGDVNTPLDFQRYIKSEFKLEVKYRHKQKFIIKKGRKILLGSAYPDLKLVYRKGVPGLLKSEVDFDYLEIGLKHFKTIGRLGDMDWSVLAGSFVNKKNLRLLEHRYFRGSDIFFFSDPLNSFQLLGPTLSTPNAFFRANYFHHFNGIVLNKIPLLHRLKITEAAGAAMLSIPDENFHHVEFYAGLERVVRIRKELFRFGIYAATADSNWEKAKFDFKFGVNFYNSFTKKWQY
jgi:hypothetical protein